MTLQQVKICFDCVDYIEEITLAPKTIKYCVIRGHNIERENISYISDMYDNLAFRTLFYCETCIEDGIKIILERSKTLLKRT